MCKLCNQQPVYKDLSGRKLCKNHFIKYWERKVRKTIKKFNLFNKNDRLAVCVSGGKDSLALLSFLNKHSELYDSLIALAIDEGISNYRNLTLKELRSFCKFQGIKLKIVSFKEEFGFRTLRPGVRTVYTPEKWEDESLMLTGDLNVAVVEWIVQYRIVDPYKYLFKVRDVRKTIRDISEVVMRMVVGDRSVDEVLTVGRMEAATQAQKKLQEILNFYDTGIKIVTVKLKDVNPPDPVKPSFNEVNEARQDRERFINEAWQAYNKVIPKAKGEAEKVIAEAEGYAIKRVNRAQGDANRFLAIWKEYKRAKDVTRKRMYIETLSKVLPRVGKIYVVDSEQKTLLPLLSLEGGKK